MLTIKAPIELKCAVSMIPSQEAFYHRITGNYELLSSAIDGEDLLHLVTTPPEIYLGEGGMSSIVNNTNIRSSQETKLEVINNLMNRIAFTDEARLTYQDRVYITDVLNKLGIRNVQQFMSQVSRLKQETQKAEELTSLYWNNLEQLTRLVEEYHHSEQHGQQMTQLQQTAVKKSLHEDVFHRLQTGAVYQILNNFYASHAESSRYVTNREMQAAEQKRAAANILLSRLKQAVGGESVPIVYRHENYYENVSLEEENITAEAVNAQITSAVLLNLADNLYLNKFESLRTGFQNWLRIDDALYRTAENTLWRLKNEMANQISRNDYRTEQAFTQQQIYENEISSIRNLLALAKEEGIRKTASYEMPPADQILISDTYGQADIEHPAASGELREDQAEMPGGAKDNKARQADIMRQIERYLDTVRRISNPGKQTEKDENINLPYAQAMESFPRKEAFSGGTAWMQEAQQPDERELGSAAALRLDYRNTYAHEENVYQGNEESDAQLEHHAEKESRTLANTYIERLERIQAQNVWNQQAYDTDNSAGDNSFSVFNREEQQIFLNPEENLELLEQELARINRQNIENYNRYTQLARTQQSEEKKKTPRKAADMTRHESLKALTSPEQLLEEYRQEAAREEDKKDQKDQKFQDIMRLLPEQARKIYEQLEDYINHPESRRTDSAISENNMALLLHDIRQVEHEEYARNTVETEEAGQMRKAQELVSHALMPEDYSGDAENREEKRERAIAEITKALPEQARKIYEQQGDYRRQPDDGQGTGSEHGAGEALLIHDIRQSEQESHEQSLISAEETRQIREMSETVLEKWNDRQTAETRRLRDAEIVRNDISLIHKSMESNIDEEALQQIMEQSRLMNVKTQVVSHVQEEKQTAAATIYQQNHQQLLKESQDITELIQRSVQRQVGAISEQVYSRLEKRLQNEKKRRGY